jgi:heme oxygenase
MFLDDRERLRRVEDTVNAVNLAVHGDAEAFDLFRQRMRRDL